MKRKRYLKQITSFMLATALVIGMVLGSVTSTNVAEAAKRSKLSKKSITIAVGKSQKLSILQKQKKAKYVWQSNNKKVAKVSSKGTVKGIKQGSTRVVCTVKAKKGKSYQLKCKVEVIKGAKKIEILDVNEKNVSSLSLYKGQTLDLYAKIGPKNSNDKVTWKSSNRKVVTVSQYGYVRAVAKGTANITATTISKKKAVVKVTVEESNISSYFKDAYAEYFTIGAAVNLRQMLRQTDMDHIMNHYNSITLENEMKPSHLLGATPELIDKSLAEFPVPNSYQEEKIPKIEFSILDEAMEIAKNKGLKMRAHTLLWHTQTPDWFFRKGYSNDGNLVSKEVMNARLEYYIQQVMTHVKTKYPGMIYAWDVVNEAFEKDGAKEYEKGLRGYFSKSGPEMSDWYNIYMDDSYVINAFTYARKYQEEGATLFYNDYNEYIPNKTANICTLAKKLKQNNLIDGIGMQAHLDLNYPSIDLIGQAIDKFKGLGLEIQLTELDVTISNTSLYAQQGEYYKKLFTMLINKKKNGANITNVTIWGLYDNVSWRSSQFPLLFFQGYYPKPAAAGILAAAGK